MLDEAIQKEIIQKGRDFLKSPLERDPYEEAFESDQDRKLPQPPLVKAPMAEEGERIALTRDFSGLALKNNLVSLIRDRRSARIYTNETMTPDELSFLLWATQGIKKIRGKAYATIRTVPCGGARHEFETYLIVRNVVGLRPGAYHYLPMLHALEFLHPIEDIPETITQTLCGQKWAARANAVFYWSVVPYRAECATAFTPTASRSSTPDTWGRRSIRPAPGWVSEHAVSALSSTRNAAISSGLTARRSTSSTPRPSARSATRT